MKRRDFITLVGGAGSGLATDCARATYYGARCWLSDESIAWWNRNLSMRAAHIVGHTRTIEALEGILIESGGRQIT
jgi:hypothetical protein